MCSENQRNDLLLLEGLCDLRVGRSKKFCNDGLELGLPFRKLLLSKLDTQLTM